MLPLPQQPDKHIRRSGDDYAAQFLAALPSGQAWPKVPGSKLERTTNGLSQYWGYVNGRAGDLLERESDPRITVELIKDWEQAFGLPDPCLQEPLTLGERQRMLVQRMTLLGAQSRQWFVEVASWLGYTITIDEFAPFMTGISRCGITLDNAGDLRWEIAHPEIRFYWRIHVDQTKLTWFRCGSGECGVDPHLMIGLATDLECLLQRWMPAQTQIVFDYSGLGVTGTSVTSNTIGLGLKTFETQNLLEFGTNMRVRASATSNTAAWMEGSVTDYHGVSITINVEQVGTGTGTFTDWTINSLAIVGAGGSMAGTP
jgi:uncharacterized protein YmfQ (DUF2313 family)